MLCLAYVSMAICGKENPYFFLIDLKFMGVLEFSFNFNLKNACLCLGLDHLFYLIFMPVMTILKAKHHSMPYCYKRKLSGMTDVM